MKNKLVFILLSFCLSFLVNNIQAKNLYIGGGLGTGTTNKYVPVLGYHNEYKGDFYGSLFVGYEAHKYLDIEAKTSYEYAKLNAVYNQSTQVASFNEQIASVSLALKPKYTLQNQTHSIYAIFELGYNAWQKEINEVYFRERDRFFWRNGMGYSYNFAYTNSSLYVNAMLVASQDAHELIEFGYKYSFK